MDRIGTIRGKTRITNFNIDVENINLVEKNKYIIINSEFYGKVLGQIKNIQRTEKKTSAEVEIIGYRDDKKLLQVPSRPFEPGTPVYTANSKTIEEILNLSPNKETSIYMGVLKTEPTVQVFLDLNTIVSKHLAVLAMSGAGKSYTVGVLLEELLEKKIPLLIFDPHGEYSGLKYPNKNPKEIKLMGEFGILPKGYSQVEEMGFGPEFENRLYLDNKNLSAYEIINILPTSISGSQKALLFEAINKLQEEREYTLEDIIAQIETAENNAKWTLLSLLYEINKQNLFSDTSMPITELVQPGKAVIINLKNRRVEEQQIIVAKLMEELFYARKMNAIPPFFMILEEAHNFAPERGFGGEVVSSKIARTIASEGRKFGLGLCVITQRAARIDKNVLSQCNTQIILKLVNPNDLRAVGQSLEGFTGDLAEDIKTLSVGSAIISGEVVAKPIIVNIRPRRSQHGGSNIDIYQQAQHPVLSSKITTINPNKVEAATKGFPLWIAKIDNDYIMLDAQSGEIRLNNVKLHYSEIEQWTDKVRSLFRQILLYKEISSTDIKSTEERNLIKELQQEGLLETENIANIHLYKSKIKLIKDINMKEVNIKEIQLEKANISENKAKEIFELLLGQNVKIIKAYKLV